MTRVTHSPAERAIRERLAAAWAELVTNDHAPTSMRFGAARAVARLAAELADLLDAERKQVTPGR